MPFKSPLTSTMRADCIAMSVPCPIAMPTLAAASAGASLMPSPAIATIVSLRLQFLDQCVLVGRQHFGAEICNAQSLRRNRCRGRRAIAGRHHYPHAGAALAHLIADSVVALIGSAIASSPSNRFSTPTNTTVLPSLRSRSAVSIHRCESMPASPRKRALPRRTPRAARVP